MRTDVEIVFQDEQGYYILEGEGPKRTRIAVAASEVFSERDEETGEYVPSDEGPPCLICDEAYANKFLNEMEQERMEQFMKNIQALLARGDIRVAGQDAQGEEEYTLTAKGASRKAIEQLAALLETADNAHRDFT